LEDELPEESMARIKASAGRNKPYPRSFLKRQSDERFGF